MHSGTSLLQKIIGRATQIYSPPGEVKFIENLPTIKNLFPLNDNRIKQFEFCQFSLNAIHKGIPYTKAIQGKDRSLPNRYAPLLREYPGGDHLDIFFNQLDRIAQIHGCTHWLEKSPNNLFYTDLILQYRPEGRFIIIVRDARDVLASKKKRSQTVNQDRYHPAQVVWKKLEKKYSPLIDNLSWASSAKAGVRLLQQNAKNAILVRYEDLVDNPKKEVQRICTFLCIPFEEEMINVQFSNAAEYAVKKQGIYRNYGNYKRTLSPVEIAFTELLVGKTLKRLGYETGKDFNLWNSFQSFYLLPLGLWQTLDRVFARFQLLGPSYFRSFAIMNINKIMNYFKK